MLSILIPCYNYNVYPVVEELFSQSSLCNITFEILIIDDASPEILYDAEKIKSYPDTQLTRNTKNKGRSATRNQLARQATYDNLVFIDAGTFPESKTFIQEYLEHLENDVVVGGMTAEETAPKKPYKLRWLYTKKKEACCDKNGLIRKVYTSANFLINKNTILAFPFNETIKTYGFEDYIFFKNIEASGLSINFIQNPVIHDSKEHAEKFIVKTKAGLQNLLYLEQQMNPYVNNITIKKWHTKICKLGLNKMVALIYKILNSILIKNLKSDHPSILLFDFYKLGYLCSITAKAK